MPSPTAGRKKQPKAVKLQLLQAAAELAVEKGLFAITLSGVAKKAQVSKGGLLHHFPDKFSLVEAMFKEQLLRISKSMQILIEGDPDPLYRFTRAYITVMTTVNDDPFMNKLFGASALAMSIEPLLAKVWTLWVTGSLTAADTTDSSTYAKTLRYAADGLWLEDATQAAPISSQERVQIISELIKATQQNRKENL